MKATLCRCLAASDTRRVNVGERLMDVKTVVPEPRPLGGGRAVAKTTTLQDLAGFTGQVGRQ
jgi:hypothetical protein